MFYVCFVCLFSESAVVHGCQPSCASNPCENGATCLEYWGSYVCECVNKYAHTGKNCENSEYP